ncbi:MAG: hypothetical protein R3Y07_07150 [Eubacteriales bacterium]
MAKKKKTKGGFQSPPPKMDPKKSEERFSEALEQGREELRKQKEEFAKTQAEFTQKQAKLKELEESLQSDRLLYDEIKKSPEDYRARRESEISAELGERRDRGIAEIDRELKERYSLENQAQQEAIEQWKAKLKFQWESQEEGLIKEKEAWYQKQEQDLAKSYETYKQELNRLFHERTQVLDQKELDQKRTKEELHQAEQTLIAQKQELETKIAEFQTERSTLRQELSNKVQEMELLEDKCGRFQDQIAHLETEHREQREDQEDEIDQLKEELKDLEKDYQDYKKNLGFSPEEVTAEKTYLMEKILEQEKIIEHMVSPEVAKELDLCKAQVRELTERLLQTQQELEGYPILKVELEEQKRKFIGTSEELSTTKRDLESHQKQLAFYNKDALKLPRDQQIAQLTSGFELRQWVSDIKKTTEELDWLGGIQARCDHIDMKFPLRILYAFHTAMKISEWSIITVLAGVSGTGKSKLPELYSHFGGLNYFSVPVQPNWDSQESMLGFFNSMDNYFESEDLLKFLIRALEIPPALEEEVEKRVNSKLQNREARDEKNARIMAQNELRTVSLVLLDEMNLAHVEQYFADFLSKLESRRGQLSVPTVDIKLGAGLQPYGLELGRNILWSGTMNQDETTKSLSDKVLDRSVVINFPRPTVFRSRTSQANQQNYYLQQRMTYQLWKSWQTNNTRYKVPNPNLPSTKEFNQEAKKEIKKYKALVERINLLLSEEGRASGHRVWQSIEYYVVNYPLVIFEMKQNYNPEKDQYTCDENLKSAINIAMEDQMVQKIMPKLRGIEWSHVLESIEEELRPHFSDAFLRDFSRACKKEGYGQFTWVTSEYAEEEANEGRLRPWENQFNGQEESPAP